jgi:hypothetical protein
MNMRATNSRGTESGTAPITKQCASVVRREVRQEVIHLREHQTADETLSAWPGEIAELKSTRPKQAERLQSKSERLRELTV